MVCAPLVCDSAPNTIKSLPCSEGDKEVVCAPLVCDGGGSETARGSQCSRTENVAPPGEGEKAREFWVIGLLFHIVGRVQGFDGDPLWAVVHQILRALALELFAHHGLPLSRKGAGTPGRRLEGGNTMKMREMSSVARIAHPHPHQNMHAHRCPHTHTHAHSRKHS